MNNHTQQFAALKQCVHNFPSLSTLVRYMSSLLGRKNVHCVFSRGDSFCSLQQRVATFKPRLYKIQIQSFFFGYMYIYVYLTFQ